MEYDRQGFATAADGTRLYYGLRGSGPIGVVLNDGIGCDGWIWERVQPELAEHHRVLHWHYRGHGRSGAPRDRAHIDIATLADDMARVMDAASMRDGVLIGHSMGVQVSLEAIRAHRDRVRALVLVCGAYGRPTTTFHGSDTLDTVLPALLSLVRRHPGVARAVFSRVPAKLAFRIARLSGEIDVDTLREEDFVLYIEHLARIEPDLFFGMLEKAGQHTAEDLLPSIDVPTLVVSGEKDTFTPPTLSHHMSDMVPGAEHFELRGASHAAPAEQPVSLCLRIEKFLRERVEQREEAPPAAERSAS